MDALPYFPLLSCRPVNAKRRALNIIFLKMSIIFSEIEELRLSCNPIGAKYAYATIDPKTVNESPLPSNYKYGKCFLPDKFAQMADCIHNFKVRSDDTWIIGHPFSGTTWMQNIISQLKNHLDFSAPATIHLYQLFEYAAVGNTTIEKNVYEMNKEFDRFDDLPSPRIFKSHLPAYLLPRELWTIRPKIIYTARNPKDIVISAHLFYKTLAGLDLAMEVTFDEYLNDKMIYTPLHEHVLSFWQLRHLDHVLFCTYEELLADQFNGVKRVSEFLKCSYSDQQLRKLSEDLSFDNMKEKISVVTVDGIRKDDSEHK